MKARILAISYVLIAFLTMPAVTLAQIATEPNREWAAVLAVQPGERLVVMLKDGKTLDGKLSSVSGSTLTLSGNGTTTDSKRESILKVYRIAGKSVKTSTLIGAAVGAAAGAGLGAASCRPRDFICLNKSVTIPVGAAVGAVPGALIGFLIGKLGHKRMLIYEARRQ